MPKPKVAFYWCASCGGCEETVVDLAEDILGVVEKVDIVLWPVAMDFKYKDVEALPDKFWREKKYSKDQGGISAVMAELLTKGTPTRNAQEIAVAVDERHDPLLVGDRDVGTQEVVGAQLSDRLGQLRRGAIPELIDGVNAQVVDRPLHGRADVEDQRAVVGHPRRRVHQSVQRDVGRAAAGNRPLHA